MTRHKTILIRMKKETGSRCLMYLLIQLVMSMAMIKTLFSLSLLMALAKQFIGMTWQLQSMLITMYSQIMDPRHPKPLTHLHKNSLKQMDTVRAKENKHKVLKNKEKFRLKKLWQRVLRLKKLRTKRERRRLRLSQTLKEVYPQSYWMDKKLLLVTEKNSF